MHGLEIDTPEIPTLIPYYTPGQAANHMHMAACFSLSLHSAPPFHTACATVK